MIAWCADLAVRPGLMTAVADNGTHFGAGGVFLHLIGAFRMAAGRQLPGDGLARRHGRPGASMGRFLLRTLGFSALIIAMPQWPKYQRQLE